jgi:sulfur-oxidizing protein SoxY
MTNVTRLQYWFAVLAVLAFVPAHANENAEPDPAQSQHWQNIRSLMFGDREIIADGEDVVRVYLNTRADDASTVPVMVNGLIDQTPERYIKSVYLIVERNPSPAAGVFYFTPESGRVKVETRLRFEDFSFVRAVAELNDGSLYMSQRWVKASGGCSAPMGKNFVPPALMGKMRFRIDDIIEYNKPTLVQVQIRHPNESALAADFDPNKTPQFVRSVDVSYNGEPVMNAQVDFSLSDNPIFRFYFVPGKEGELKVEVEDTHDKTYSQSIRIAEGVQPVGG